MGGISTINPYGSEPTTGGFWHLGGEIWQVCDSGRNIGALIRGRSSHPFQHLALYPVAESSSHWMGGKSTGNSGNHGFFLACARGFPVKMSLHHF